MTGSLAAWFAFRAATSGDTASAIYSGAMGLLAILDARVVINKYRFRAS